MDLKANGKHSGSNTKLSGSPLSMAAPKESKGAEIALGSDSVPSIRLTPEQIEEVHADEYSLTLFYATRMEPLSLLEMKRQFPEPEPKKVQSVMERFLEAELVHVTKDGRYFSNFPENYINYSDYRYDSDLEAKKDDKVFRVMKEQTGKIDYWRDKIYFSMDAFYSEEQTRELMDMFKSIRIKAKEYANQNAKKKSIKGLKFRRIKFYDMTFAFVFALVLSLGVVHQSRAAELTNSSVRLLLLQNAGQVLAMAGGGNDPTAMVVPTGPAPGQYANSTRSDDCEPGQTPADNSGTNQPNDFSSQMKEGSGFGMPGMGNESDHKPFHLCGPHTGGGGRDPIGAEAGIACYLRIEDQVVGVKNPRLCQLQGLVDLLSRCESAGAGNCDSVAAELKGMMGRIDGGN